jgi:hypothetical protein
MFFNAVPHINYLLVLIYVTFTLLTFALLKTFKYHICRFVFIFLYTYCYKENDSATSLFVVVTTLNPSFK